MDAMISLNIGEPTRGIKNFDKFAALHIQASEQRIIQRQLDWLAEQARLKELANAILDLTEIDA